jgi:hypothetical protein
MLFLLNIIIEFFFIIEEDATVMGFFLVRFEEFGVRLIVFIGVFVGFYIIVRFAFFMVLLIRIF